MKSIISLFISLLLLHSAFGQSNNVKHRAIDDLLRITKTQESAQIVVEHLIAMRMKEVPNAPKQLEQEIRNAIDYSKYMNEVKNAYDITYSEAEIMSLLKLYKDGDMKKFKEENSRIEKRLYDIGRHLGKEVTNIISAKLAPYK